MDATVEAKLEIAALDSKLANAIASEKERHREKLKEIRTTVILAKREWQRVIDLDSQITKAKAATAK